VTITTENIGKRYRREWIIRGMNAEFQEGEAVALLGANGSGKSTLLAILSGYLSPSEGSIRWEHHGKQKTPDDIFREITWCTPAMQLYDDLTLAENFVFFSKFKKFRHALSLPSFAERLELEAQLNKPLKQFSSGMKQRVKLGLAILGESSLLLLDEPTSFLDESAVAWYQKLLSDERNGRLIFIASNRAESETFLCERRIDVAAYKNQLS
jgi:ABC-type multidrug transport system ATPase subunit